MKAILCKFVQMHDCVFTICEKYLSHLLLLGVRFWLAYIFFTSGLSKIASWSATLYLFEYEYAVPFIPFELAAYLATATELIASALIAVGALARLSTIPLFVLTLVIEYTYPSQIEHLYWGILILTIACFGAGRLSIDHWAKKFFKTSSCT